MKELSEAGVKTNINAMLDAMPGIKRITTFFGELKTPEKVEFFTMGSDLAQQIENLYQLKKSTVRHTLRETLNSYKELPV